VDTSFDKSAEDFSWLNRPMLYLFVSCRFIPKTFALSRDVVVRSEKTICSAGARVLGERTPNFKHLF